MTETTTKRHVFELAGLGPAPYRSLGVRENLFTIPGFGSKPGGSCDYCANGIRYEFHLRAADGREFKVGSECILKAGDAGLRRVVTAHERAKRKAKADAVRAKSAQIIEDARAQFAAHRDAFAAHPHRRGFTDRTTGRPLTLADDLDWTFANCGTTGRLVAAKVVTRVLTHGLD